MQIFKLIGSIFVDTDEANSSIAKTDSKAKDVGQTLASGVKTAAKWGAAIVAAGAAAVTGIVALATDSASAADEIDKMSQKIGISRQAYQELDYILSQNGMDVNQLQTSMKTLVNQMSDAQSGTESAKSAFAALGVAVTNSDGSLRSQEDVFYDTISALQSMENETERAAIANGLFGKSASELAPLFNSGAGSMEELRQAANDLGLVLGDDVIDAGVELTDSIDTMKRSFEALKNNLGGALMPILNQFVQLIIDNMPLIQSMFDTLAPILQQLLATLLPPLMQLVTAILPMIVQLVESLLPLISTLFEGILPVFVNLLGSIMPVLIQLIEAVLPVVVSLLDALLPILEPLLGLLAPILELVLALIQPLLDLLDLILPGIAWVVEEVLAPALSAIAVGVQAVAEWFVKAWQTIKSAWTPFAAFFSNIWTSVKTSAKNAIDGFVGFFKNAWTTIKGIYNGVASFFTGVFTKAWDGIVGAFSAVKTFFQGVFDTIKSLFKTPHFTFSGSLNPLNWASEGTPKIAVEWYKQGGVMLDPTLFGINPQSGSAMAGGEAGPEAIAPIDTLQRYIAEAVGNEKQITLLETIVALLRQGNDEMYDNIVSALVDGVKIDIDKREFGRMVRTYA